MFFTHILRSLRDGKYYYGHTDNLKKRLDYHNRGKVRSTKSRIPLIIHYFENFDTKSNAFKREQFLRLLQDTDF